MEQGGAKEETDGVTNVAQQEQEEQPRKQQSGALAAVPHSAAAQKPLRVSLLRAGDGEGRGQDSDTSESTDESFGGSRRKIKRVGRAINKKTDEGYELIFDILMGIRNTVSRTQNRPISKKAKLSEFREILKEKYPSRGTQTTPAHSNRDFTFVDIAPVVFRRVRKLFGINPADYLISLTAEYQLSEIISPGKSKSFFYFSYDMKYMLKTVYPFEAEFFKKILPHYFDHLNKHPHTLLTRFLGFHAVKPHKGSLTYFVVMNNIFAQNQDLSLKYDLKGSTYGRSAFKKPPPPDADLTDVIQKDLDFNRRIQLGPIKRKAFISQLLADSHFLESLSIMDYSLLLGVHFVSRGMYKTKKRRATVSKAVPVRNFSFRDVDLLLSKRQRNRASSSEDTTNDNADDAAPREDSDEEFVSFFEQDNGGIRSTDEDNNPLNEIYYVGIIDILQPYNLYKKFESKFKIYGFRIPKSGLSAVGPHLYCKRFQDFIIARVGPGEVIDLRKGAKVRKGNRIIPSKSAVASVRESASSIKIESLGETSDGNGQRRSLILDAEELQAIMEEEEEAAASKKKKEQDEQREEEGEHATAMDVAKEQHEEEVRMALAIAKRDVAAEEEKWNKQEQLQQQQQQQEREALKVSDASRAIEAQFDASVMVVEEKGNGARDRTSSVLRMRSNSEGSSSEDDILYRESEDDEDEDGRRE